jgi:PAS domain S-box-containing protein
MDQFRLAIDAIPGMVWTFLSDGYVDFLNRRWCDYTGLRMEEARGWGWQSAIHPDDRVALVEYCYSLLASGTSGETEGRLRRFDGSYRWCIFRATPVADEQGRIVKWYGLTTDIDDRKRADTLLAGEKLLLEALARGESLRGILEALCRLVEKVTPGALCSILVVDHDGKHLKHFAAPSIPTSYVRAIDGSAIARFVGPCASAACLRESVLASDFAVDDGRWPESYRTRALDHGFRACWSTPILSSDSRLLGTFAMYFGAPGPGVDQRRALEQCSHIASIAIEHTIAQRALKRARVRELEARYAAIVEERTRLAREIHDTLLQGFNGVTLLLLHAASKVVAPAEAVSALQDVLNVAQTTLADARKAVWDLRAPALRGDFIAGLRGVAEDAVRGTGLILEFSTRGSASELQPDSEAVVIRLVQEAIANTVKHAAAKTVRVRLSYRRRRLEVSVRDDGSGFAVPPDLRSRDGHWGLLGMRERASQIGAKLRVHSADGVGTTITLVLPFAALNRDGEYLSEAQS